MADGSMRTQQVLSVFTRFVKALVKVDVCASIIRT